LTFLCQLRFLGAGQGWFLGSPHHPPISQSDGTQDVPLFFSEMPWRKRHRLTLANVLPMFYALTVA
jgi:hypothetical protein